MMKRLLFFVFFMSLGWSTLSAQDQSIQWLSFEEAAEIAEKGTNKKFFIDVYTDWCGWCKKMDKETFNDPKVRAYMLANYHMVKFNAEQAESITYKGETYRLVGKGRSMYHELAYALTQGNLSYPTVIFMTERFEVLSPVAGYYPASPFLHIATYFGDSLYETMTWQDYEASLNATR
ncbi:MAG: hypothetical protein RLZZ242_661 [Bacteroidota bacterium]